MYFILWSNFYVKFSFDDELRSKKPTLDIVTTLQTSHHQYCEYQNGKTWKTDLIMGLDSYHDCDLWAEKMMVNFQRIYVTLTSSSSLYIIFFSKLNDFLLFMDEFILTIIIIEFYSNVVNWVSFRVISYYRLELFCSVIK